MWKVNPGTWCLCLWLLAAATMAAPPPDEVEHPLKPIDQSSPRATLESFLETGDSIARMLSGEYWRHPSRELVERIRAREKDMLRMVDLSRVPPAARADVGTDTLIYLYEVLSRIQLPPLDEIPDAEEIESLTGPVAEAPPQGRAQPTLPPLPFVMGGQETPPKGVATTASWVIPNTEITLVRVAEGPRAGQFVFSADTVARAEEFYKKVRELPYLRDVPLKHYAEMRTYLAKSGWLVPPSLIQSLPNWMRRGFLRQAIWKWIVLLAVLLVFAALVVVVHKLVRRVRAREGILAHLVRFATPLLMLLGASPMARWLNQQLSLTGKVAQGVSLIGEAVTYLSLAWIVWLAPVILAESYISTSSRVQGESLNANLLRFIARSLGLAGIIVIIFQLSSRLGAPLFSLIAGFGVGGIAVALAAQSSIENFIGSLNLFGDKPVSIGDVCRYGDDSGPDYLRIGKVESIGMRSTRIRGLDQSLTTIPNADFCKLPIVNYTQRNQVSLITVLGLRYETSDDQLRYVLANLRELLLMHPKVADEEPCVRLEGFSERGFDIEVRVNINTPDFTEFRAIREDILLRMIRIVREAGTNFAFPSQTVYLSRDRGLDTERGEEAESRVRAWAAAQQMPFPNFSADYRRRYRDTLDYPPEGSPDARD